MKLMHELERSMINARFQVDADGYYPFEQNVLVEDGRPSLLNVTLEPADPVS